MLEQKLWDFIRKNLEKADKNSRVFHSTANIARLESCKKQGKKSFILKVPSLFHQSILRPYLPKIMKQIKNYMEDSNYEKKIEIINSDKDFNTNLLKQASFKPNLSPSYSKKSSFSFVKKWNFSTFIQGPSNCFAWALAKNIASYPSASSSYNPLFIYGESGLGKTHLLHAIGLTIEQNHPNLNVMYLPAERFFNECIFHIRKNNMHSFRQKYRTNIQVLLLDDVQILGRGESTQEEFFHTFEALIQQNCQIVLASDTAPKNIKGLKNRIQTRFNSGVIADIQRPDTETKLAILKNKSFCLKLKLSEELLSYILKNPSNSIRELEGYLNKIKMYCELQKISPSLQLLQKLFPLPEENNISALDIKNFKNPLYSCPAVLIQKEICNFFKLKNTTELLSRSRNKKIVLARNLAMYIAREDFNLSLKAIGRAFGARDHSTVLKALKKIKILLKNKKLLSNQLNQLQKAVYIKFKEIRM